MFQFLQLFISIVMFILNPHLLITSASSSYYDCSHSSKACPSGDKIEYPFYLEKSSDEYYCGYPGLSAKCSEEGRPIITLSNHSYYYEHFSVGGIRAVDIDILHQKCPQPRHNFSLGAVASLLFIDGNVNATFFYNCTTLPKHVSLNLPCIKNNYNAKGRSFATYGIIPKEFNWYDNCQEKVVVPINYYPFNEDITDLLEGGVMLGLKLNQHCQNCEKSGGKCTYNRHSKIFSCSCGKEGKLFDKVCPHSS